MSCLATYYGHSAPRVKAFPCRSHLTSASEVVRSQRSAMLPRAHRTWRKPTRLERASEFSAIGRMSVRCLIHIGDSLKLVTHLLRTAIDVGRPDLVEIGQLL